MQKGKLAFWLSMLALFIAAFFARNSIIGFFAPRLAGFEESAASAALQAVEKNFSAPAPLRAPALSGGSSSNGSDTLTREGTVLWTNKERVQNGNLPPLAENDTLNTIAELRLQDMFKNQYFAHVSPASSSAVTVASQVGYDYLALGENLALGNFPGDEGVVEAWMGSPGHRANILNTHYTQIGVAVGRGAFQGESVWIAVQVFGRPASDCPVVDASLKSTIDATQAELQSMQSDLAAKKAALDSMRPGPQYNEKVSEYNALVAQYNAILKSLQADIAAYNGEVTALNSCISG
ncbi:MAG TPA: CAP domain-containing protein [Candidatus Paceibacterota bacterium]|nr:CAP domain-containing protein [Candidatus Paceibacterota bacterium]